MLHLSLPALCALAALPLYSAAAQNGSSSYTVDLGYATYQGSLNDSVVQYFGIPYAAAPVGDLRWRPPVDIERQNNLSSDGIILATQRGPICVQGVPYWRPNPSLEGTGSEDCLLLDVLLPPGPVSDSLPVLVQIHGGGYDQGNSESNPGYQLVNQSQGQLMYVSIQYRLAAFGFLSSVDVREDGAANVGLLDQRAALGWVQRHVKAFGGDPDKVTIIGGSAGGGSVMDQMILQYPHLTRLQPEIDAGTELHGADGPFLWGPTSSPPNNLTLANIMKDYYIGFVVNLDPNSINVSGTAKPFWPEYQSDDGFRVMDVNDTMIGVIPDMDANARCDFLHGQSYVVRN